MVLNRRLFPVLSAFSLFIIISCEGSSPEPQTNVEDAATNDQSNSDPSELENGSENPESEDTGEQNSETNPTAEAYAELEGVVRIFEYEQDGQRAIGFSGGFIRSSESQFQGHSSFIDRDYCEPVRTSATRSNHTDEPTLISAGDAIVISNQNGTLLELNERYAYNITEDYYGEILSITAEQTQNLVIDIPGEEFPAYPAIAVANIEPITNLQPVPNSEIDNTAVFRWTPSSIAGTHMGLGATFADEDNTYGINCFFEDDGIFEFPASLKNEINGLSTERWSISRRHFVDESREGSYLEIQRYLPVF